MVDLARVWPRLWVARPIMDEEAAMSDESDAIEKLAAAILHVVRAMKLQVYLGVIALGVWLARGCT